VSKLPDIPRDEWNSHPNWPDQTLLLRSHDGFRRISRQLVEAARSRANNSEDVASLRYVFRHWKSAMKSHERYEEMKLYPYLEARYGVTLGQLEEQHQQLGRLEHDVYAAWDAGDGQALAAALKAHDETLIAHLAQEEEAVIPLLLSLTRQEFEHYAYSSARTLLAELAALAEPTEPAES
jgi:hemerythrin-like domain-containing protein